MPVLPSVVANFFEVLPGREGAEVDGRTAPSLLLTDRRGMNSSAPARELACGGFRPRRWSVNDEIGSVFRRSNRAGRSAHRRHRELSKAWRRRVLGRRTGILVWATLLLAVLLLQHAPLSERWALVVGSWVGAIAAGWVLLPDAAMPGWIGNWRLGGWGEENTASEVNKLKRQGWTIRHDLATSTKANIDHLLVGPSAYVLDSKNLKDSIVTVEAGGLRVTRVDDPESSYLLDRFPVRGQSFRFEQAIEAQLGFRAQVQPVVVVWGRFEEREAWLGSLAVVEGAHLVEWLESRPRTLVRDEHRASLAAWAQNLRSA